MWSVLSRLGSFVSGFGYTPIIFGTVILGLFISTWYYKNQTENLTRLLARSDLLLEQCQKNVASWQSRFNDARIRAESQCSGLRDYYESLPPPPGGGRTYLPPDDE